MTYKIQIPLNSTIEIEIDGSKTMSYADILSSITEVDLKEASLHLPIEDITNSFVRSVAKSNIKINAVSA